MSLKAGRVGVAPDQVDEFGKIKSEATSGYTKQEADTKFETKAAAASALAEKQSITLAVPISMLEGSLLVSKTTVEDVIQTMNNAMTNRELTQEHVVYDDVVTSEYTLDANYKHVRKIGKLVICDVRLTGVTADANALLFLVPEGFRPYKGVKIRTYNDQAGFIGTNGYFSIGQALNNGECTLHADWFTD